MSTMTNNVNYSVPVKANSDPMQTWDNSQFFNVQFQEPAVGASDKTGGKVEAPSRVKIKADAAQSSQDYIKRRNRNNVAVKKSREKSKQKGATTLENIDRLKEENVLLEKKVEVLSKELTVLKRAFMDHAKGSVLPDVKQLEELLGHKLTDKVNGSSCSTDDV